MHRIAIPRRQSDLFAAPADLRDPPQEKPASAEEIRSELDGLVAFVSAATSLPFADAAAALAVELRVESLAARLGADGGAVAARFRAEMERLYAAGEA